LPDQDTPADRDEQRVRDLAGRRIRADTIVAGRPVICPSSIRKPKPLLAPISSAAITNIQPSAKPARRPVI
jgi:hypothetical protein